MDACAYRQVIVDDSRLFSFFVCFSFLTLPAVIVCHSCCFFFVTPLLLHRDPLVCVCVLSFPLDKRHLVPPALFLCPFDSVCLLRCNRVALLLSRCSCYSLFSMSCWPMINTSFWTEAPLRATKNKNIL